MAYVTQTQKGEERNRLYLEDLPVHEWYRFVLSFPPHLVRTYIERFGLSGEHWVFDPFCGTGTTLVECKKLGIPSIGLEANPVVHFAAQVKTNWRVDPEALKAHAQEVAEAAHAVMMAENVEDESFFQPLDAKLPARLRTLDAEQQRLLIKDSISPRPLHKTLVLLEQLTKMYDGHAMKYERLALAKQLVYSISNLRFGPEIGVGRVKEDAPVIGPWLRGVQSMADDLHLVRDRRDIPVIVHHADARQAYEVVAPASVDAVITSPPYPNEKDYSRTTRLESVLLGFMRTRKDLRRHKQKLLRSNTRSVYKADTDDQWIADFPRVNRLAEAIEARRLELGKTSGFERLYARVVKLYFGGMARHLEVLKPLLKPGAQLAYVVGDQASFFRIPIRTGEILAEIAERLGYEVTDIDLFRTRFSTATQEQLREEVVLLRWNA